MATVATRAPKRDLAPDWRDALREAVRRFALRSWGVLLVGLSLAGAVALATHNPNDPSLSTAAGGPAGKLARRLGCLCQRHPAAPFRARCGAAAAGGRDCGPQNDPTATGGT